MTDLKVMAGTIDALGKRMSEELDMQLGVHPHLGSQLQTQHELEFIMANTDPEVCRPGSRYRTLHHGGDGSPGDG